MEPDTTSAHVTSRKRYKPSVGDVPGTAKKTRESEEVVSSTVSKDSLLAQKRAQIAHQKAKTTIKSNQETGSISEMIRKVLEQNGTKNMFNVNNCFSSRAALDMFQPGDIEGNSIPIQDAAILLDSSQQIYGYRVEKTFKDACATQKALIEGSVKNLGNDEDGGENNEDGTTKQKRKKKELPEGATISDYLNQVVSLDIDDDQDEEDMIEKLCKLAHRKGEDGEEDPEKAEWASTDDLEAKLAELHAYKSLRLSESLNQEGVQCVVDDTTIELSNTDIDWLQKNCYYQKAIRGTEDNQLYIITYHGRHSSDGRIFHLHPRLVDPDANKKPSTEDIALPFVRSINCLIDDGLSELPMCPQQFLIPDIPDRPKLGQFLLRRVDSQRPDIQAQVSNTTVMMTGGDVTVMVPRQTPSVTSQFTAANTTMAPRPDSSPSNPNLTVNPISPNVLPARSQAEERQLERAKEFQPMNLEEFTMDNDILPWFGADPLLPRMLHIEELVEEKAKMVEDGESENIWKTGINAEEWNDSEAVIEKETQFMKRCQIEQYVKAMDLIARGELVTMRVKKDDFETLLREQKKLTEDERKATHVMDPQRYFFLRKPAVTTRNYPADPYANDEEQEFCADTAADLDETMEIETPAGDEPMSGENDMGVLEEMDDVGNFGGLDDDDLGRDNQLEQVMRQAEQLSKSVVQEPEEPEPDVADPDEIPEFISEDHPEDLRIEAQIELRQLGKEDDAHWAADQGSSENKRKEKKERAKKKKVEDFAHFFAPLSKEEMAEKVASVRFPQAKKETLFRDEKMIFMADKPECRQPHMAYPVENLFRSRLFFNKNFMDFFYERENTAKSRRDLLVESVGKSNENVIMGWLNSYKNNKIHIKIKDSNEPDVHQVSRTADFTSLADDGDFGGQDDEIGMNMGLGDYRNHAMSQMPSEVRSRFEMFSRTTDFLRQDFASNGFDDEDEEAGGPTSNYRMLAAKERDPEKQKREIRSILQDPRVSLPKLQGVLNMKKKINSGGPEDLDVSLSGTFHGLDTEEAVDAEEVLRALTEVHDYEEEEEEARRRQAAEEMPELRKKTRVHGLHTFQSAYVCLPHRNREPSAPAAFLSCALQLANESNLLIHQDRKNRNWMSDCVIYNGDEQLPPEILNQTHGAEIDDEIWEATNDPCARRATAEIIAAARKKFGLDQDQVPVKVEEERPASRRNLRTRPAKEMSMVEEEKEDEEEEMEEEL